VARFLEESELTAELPANAPVRAALASADVERAVLRAQGSASYHPFAPPSGPVRFPAEHEAIRSVLLAWPTQYPVRWRQHAELAREIASRAETHIVAPNAAWARAISLFLRTAGARLDSIRYICAPNDDVWIRDYGPTLVQSAAGPVFIANPYVPNGLGFHKRDHELPVEIARVYGLPVHRLPLIIEGGNLLSDGAGRIFLTDSVFAHNPDCDARALSEIMRRWFGATELTVLPALPQDVTGHVDIALKLAGNGGAWVTQAPSGHPWRETLDEIAAIAAKTRTPRGDYYQVVRMPIAPSSSGTSEYCYCNSLTVNGAILYPSYGSALSCSVRCLHVSTTA
jgi:agmatine deiminase